MPGPAVPLLVASDVHLTSRDPEGVARFLRFLRGPCREVAAVVLAGDLFDVWTTDDQAEDPGLAGVFGELRDLVRRGVDVGFTEGNRDFLATNALRDAGVRRLPDVVVAGRAEEDAPGLRVVVTHGDRLCTRDVRYQAFRRFARGPTIRHLVASAPRRVAAGTARAAREGSRRETARKAYGDMGISPLAAADLLRAHGADALVCGHVHWGRTFALDVDGEERTVVVLGAWDGGDPSFVRFAGDRIDFERVP